MVAGYGRVSTRFVQNGPYMQCALGKSAENGEKWVFHDGGHDGGVRILSLVTVGSRHDVTKIGSICCVHCRRVVKYCR